MAWSVFRLLVVAAAAVAILWVFMTYYAPLFFQEARPGEEIKQMLGVAEANEGSYNTRAVRYSPGQVFSARSFDSDVRSVAFTCFGGGCCTEGVEPEEGCKLVIGPAKLRARENAKLQTSARCVYENNLFVCRVYFGNEPAQLEITRLEVPESIDLDVEGGRAEFSVRNTGKVKAFDVITELKLYIEEEEEGTTIKTFYGSLFSELTQELGSNQEKAFTVPLEITDAGSYVLELETKAEDAGLDRQTKKFTASGGALSPNCVATQSATIKSDQGQCVSNYFCEGCEFAFECKARWQEQGETGLEIADPGFAQKVTEAVDGEC